MIWFRTYQYAPDDNAEKLAGIPIAWPWETTEQDEQPEGKGWQSVKTAKEYEAYKAPYYDEHDAVRERMPKPVHPHKLRRQLAELLTARLVQAGLDEDTSETDAAIEGVKAAILSV